MSTPEEKLYYVTQTLEEHQTRIAELYSMQHSFEKKMLVAIEKLESYVKVELAKLKLKAGVWGLTAGVLPVTAAALIYVLKGSL
jgi:hypothetical protein